MINDRSEQAGANPAGAADGGQDKQGKSERFKGKKAGMSRKTTKSLSLI
jgi:hypothetical protein